MKRELPAGLADLEPNLRDVAERAARRAGMGLDEWIAATLREQGGRSGKTAEPLPFPAVDGGAKARGADEFGPAPTAGRGGDTALAAVSRVADERRPGERSAPSPDRAIVNQGLAAAGQRINEIEQRFARSGQPPAGEQLADQDPDEEDLRPEPADGQVDALLRSLEQRVADMQGRLSPGARRTAEEVGAVAEIRSRQTELDDGEPVRRAPAPSAAALARAHADALESLKGDLARLFGTLEDRRAAADAAPAVEALRGEIERMRQGLDGLATRNEVLSVEQALRELGEHAAAARNPGEVGAVAGHLQALQDELRRLGETVTTDLHKRLGRDLETLSRKVDGVAESGVDARVADALVRQLDDLRSQVGDLADPRRVEHLSERLTDLGRDVAEIGQRQIDLGEFAALRSAVEDVRLQLKHPRPQRSDPETLRRLEAILSKLEALGEDRSALDLSAAAQQIETAAGRLGEITQRLPRDGVDAVARQVEALGRRLDERTGVEALTRHVEAIAKRVEARDDVGSVATHLEAIYERLDDRGGLDAVQRQVSTLASTLAQRFDRERAGPDLLGRIEQLSAKLDRVAEDHEAALSRSTERLYAAATAPAPDPSAALDGLTERLDRLDERLRQAGPREDRLQPMEAMLGALAARLDQMDGPGAGAEALDALQRQVGLLARRMEAPSDRDPTLAALQHSMGELLDHVESLREGALDTAERAARAAVADTLGHPPSGAPDLHGIRDDLDALKSQASAADRRVQDALEAVHQTLEAVATRLAGLGTDGTAAVADASPVGADRVADRHGAPETIRVSRAAAAPAGPIARPDLPHLGAEDEVLLEPGAERPQRAARGSGLADPAVNDIKAMLIAHARRAAQSAAAEAAAASGPRDGAASGARAFSVAGPGRVAARLRNAVERHRKPLLLGLAAVILAIGALQIGPRLLPRQPETVAAVPPATTLPSTVPQQAGDAAAQAAPARAPVPAEPRTTQALANRGPSEVSTAPTTQPDADRKLGPAAEKNAALAAAGAEDGASTLSPRNGARAVPPPAPERIGDMAGVPIPPAFAPAALRQAAVAGDPAAVFEVGARAAEGRGMARDLSLAAKLFEKVAAHGNAPAQYRIGNQFEKGVGVPRDLSQAKAWYARAAEGGNIRAMHNLAVLLAEGAGDKPDYAAAVQWFRRAAEHGVRDSQFNLGVLLARGLGTDQNLIRSYIWFAVAAAGGDADAGRKRDEIGERLSPADLAEAKLAAESFRPQASLPAANEAPRPTQEWTDAAPQPKKTAGARV